MKTFSATFFALLAASLVGAQSLAPSPTESVGCEPHGDHWHCDGPATATGSAAAATTTHSDDDHDDHDDHDETGSHSLAPSPTESVGCEAHGDHWHCDGPASVTGSVGAVTTTSHTDASGTGSLAPSPTESIGCEPHGNHWHCDGPASTASTRSASSTTAAAATTTAVPAGAASIVVNGAAIVGGLLAAVAL